MDHPATASPRLSPRGLLLLVVSGLGFPLSQVAIAVLGRRGAALVETVVAAFLVRDARLLSDGTARRPPMPGALLCLELAAACLAGILGLRSLTSHGLRDATARRPGAVELVRRVALGALFGLHTWRLAISLGTERVSDRRSRPGGSDHPVDRR
jgi:hypothetical protein